MPHTAALAARFPADFTFGVATAAFQIEGANAEDGRQACIWDEFCAKPGKVKGGDDGAIACDHYHRWEKDLDLLQSMGVDAYRFSIAWPRVIPEGRGPVNTRGLDFYDRLIDGLLARNIKVFPTLYHWDLPVRLQARGGWCNRDTAYSFADYAEVVAKRLGDRMDTLVTFNEPYCSCYLGHLLGVHAPGIRNLAQAMQAVHTTNLAHGLAVQAIRSVRSLPLGIVLNATSLVPGTESEEDAAATERQFQFDNGVFFGPLFGDGYDAQLMDEIGELLPIEAGDLQTIRQPLDFWGFNYYFPTGVSDARSEASVFPHTKSALATDSDARTDIGWEIDPDGLSRLLRQVYARYELPPCYITENGAAYNTEPGRDGTIDDETREQYLAAHLGQLAQAIEEGIDVRGYFGWSLMDNFEWAEGYSMRFGLVHVDYGTQVRTLKRSGHWYASLLEEHDQKNMGS